MVKRLWTCARTIKNTTTSAGKTADSFYLRGLLEKQDEGYLIPSHGMNTTTNLLTK